MTANRRAVLGLGAGMLAASRRAGGQLPPSRRPPACRALPLPHDEVSLLADDRELCRYHFSPRLRRPFLYPITGPSGRSLTRMGHPQAPASHSHHNSVWIAHNDVNGDAFWPDTGAGRIVHQWVVRYVDEEAAAGVVTVNHWLGKDDRLHLVERRGIEIQPLADGEWLLLLDLQLEAPKSPAVLGKTPFGLVAVRVAKSVGVNDGGGTIRNSGGQVNEKGPEGCFWKPARWVDYSGPIRPGVSEGLTLMDHPANPNHPSTFHVRDDGWMGACLTFDASRPIEPGQPLRLRYGLFVHRDLPPLPALQRRWEAFSRTKLEPLPNDRR